MGKELGITGAFGSVPSKDTDKSASFWETSVETKIRRFKTR